MFSFLLTRVVQRLTVFCAVNELNAADLCREATHLTQGHISIVPLVNQHASVALKIAVVSRGNQEFTELKEKTDAAL